MDSHTLNTKIPSKVEELIQPIHQPIYCSVVGCNKLALHLIRPLVAWIWEDCVNRQYVGPTYAFCNKHYYDEK